MANRVKHPVNIFIKSKSSNNEKNYLVIELAIN
jgi:hypothetical protein